MMLILIPIIAVPILFERRSLVNLLHSLAPHMLFADLLLILNNTIHAYYQFIKGMLVVYLFGDILNSIRLLLLGVLHAILFGFIVAVLTSIAKVEIMIGASLPIVVSWLTYNTIYYPIGLNSY